jgi:hypothetical protein
MLQILETEPKIIVKPKFKSLISKKTTLASLLEMGYSRLGKFTLSKILSIFVNNDEYLFAFLVEVIEYRLKKLLQKNIYFNIESLLYILKEIISRQNEQLPEETKIANL